MANENAITKIQLKTKTSLATEVDLSEIPLAQGEPLVNTNNNTVIIGTSSQADATADNGDVIVLGNGRNVITDNNNNSITLEHYDGNFDSPGSEHIISSDEHLLLDVDNSNINLKHTKYTAHLIFGTYAVETEKNGEKIITTYAKVIGCKPNCPSKIIIPHNYNGVPVAKIEYSANYNWDDIVDIYLPDSLQSIDMRVFENNISIKQLNIPKSVNTLCYNNIELIKTADTDTSGKKSIADFFSENGSYGWLIKHLTINYNLLAKYLRSDANDFGKITHLIVRLSSNDCASLSSINLASNATLQLTGRIVVCTKENNPIGLPQMGHKLILDGELINNTTFPVNEFEENNDVMSGSLANIWDNCISIKLTNKVKHIPAKTKLPASRWNSSTNKDDIILTLPSTLKQFGLCAITLPAQEISNAYSAEAPKIRTIGNRNFVVFSSSKMNIFSGEVDVIQVPIHWASTGPLVIPNGVQYISSNAFANIKKIKYNRKDSDKWPVDWLGTDAKSNLISEDTADNITSIKEIKTDEYHSKSYTYELDGRTSYELEVYTEYPSQDNYDTQQSHIRITSVIDQNDNSITWDGDTGRLTTASFNATSDARLKENFEEYTCDKSILDLPIYKFDFINGAKNQIGCKAQDLQEICPEIVTEGSDGYLSIQESKIVYLLLEEIKKLKEELSRLK